jgi:hypothetical protein
MPLTMRSTGLESPVDKNRQDFTIYSGDWVMAVSTSSAPKPHGWFWSL